MAGIFHCFLRNRASLSIAAKLNLRHYPKPTPSVMSHYEAANGATDKGTGLIPSPSLNPVLIDNAKSARLSWFYPSFPFGYWLDPITLNGLKEIGFKAEAEDAGMIYADSVKKKRKKKMNKHKYKKLRKSLRKKT